MEYKRCYGCMRELDNAGDVCPHCGYDNTEGPKAQPTHALPCGSVLAGHYVTGRVLGQGGFGLTYIGWNLSLDLPVCIKEYFPAGAAMRSATQSCFVLWSGGENAEELRRGRESFVREAQKAVRLRDLDSVVEVWDVFYENETAYIVMDYIEGETLKSHLLRLRRTLDEKECAELMRPVISDLKDAHARGIIHRDIKPDNLMLRPDGRLMLLDLGAAKDLGGGSGQSSFMVASQGFSPKEQYRKNGLIGPWTDVYALCATMVWCVSGKLPPSPLDREDGEEVDLSAFTPAMRKVMKKGLAIKVEDRMQSAEELLTALAECCAGRDPYPAEEASAQENKAAPEGTDVSRRPNSAAVEAGKGGQVEKGRKKSRLPLLIGAAVLITAVSAFAYYGGMLPERTVSSASSPPEDAASTPSPDRSLFDVIPTRTKSQYAEAKTACENGEYEKAIELFSGISDYADSADQIQRCRNELAYREAEALAQNQEYKTAGEAFEALGSFRDSETQARKNYYHYASALIEKGMLQEGCLLLTQKVNRDGHSYEDSVELANRTEYQYASGMMEALRYREAMEAYAALGDYQDSMELSREARYQYAMQLADQKDYEKASKQFAELGEYEDSASRAQEANYQYGLLLLENKNYSEAETVLGKLGDYKDSEKKTREARYQQGLALQKSGKYDEAIEIFTDLGRYSDSSIQILETQYLEACELLKNKKYTQAEAAFLELGTFHDSKDKRREAMYDYCKAHMSRSDSVTFEYLKELRNIGYKDAKEKYLSMFGWKATLVVNNSETDRTTRSTSIRRADTIWCHISVSGGPPGESTGVKVVCSWPSTSSTLRFDSPFYNGSTGNAYFWLNDPSKEHSGKVTVKLYVNSEEVCTETLRLT